MTSNIGSDLILQAGDITPKVRQEIESLLHKHFRPEFLNRIDQTVFFRSLTEADMHKIVEIQLASLQRVMHDKGIELVIKPSALKMLAELGFVKEFGARPLKRAVQQYVVNPLAVEVLKHPDKKLFIVDAVKGSLTIA